METAVYQISLTGPLTSIVIFALIGILSLAKVIDIVKAENVRKQRMNHSYVDSAIIHRENKGDNACDRS